MQEIVSVQCVHMRNRACTHAYVSNPYSSMLISQNTDLPLMNAMMQGWGQRPAEVLGHRGVEVLVTQVGVMYSKHARPARQLRRQWDTGRCALALGYSCKARARRRVLQLLFLAASMCAAPHCIHGQCTELQGLQGQ
jgi:hypothetical protein